jgi:hypothetical protein
MTPEEIDVVLPLLLEAKEIGLAFDQGYVWFSHVKTKDVMCVYDWGEEADAADVISIPQDPTWQRHVRRLCRDRYKPWSLDWGDSELAEFGDGMYVISRALAWPVPDNARTIA